ncbi:hypothetical protein [Ectothiorhodospira mobilis]|uniref:hypothetical protein n=1 Tax=Ectothiorhodospira mobilis TaxID=195064 RepID=UPI001904EAC0|nr:hypothetical protein [Ectothiorhodospira mobilis]
MISAEEFAAHREGFQAFVATVHRFAGLLFVLTFLGYGAAVWAWFQGASWTALIVATLSYLFFRQFRRLSVNLAHLRYASRPEHQAMLNLLDRALEQDKPHVVLSQLESMVHDARRRAAQGQSEEPPEG